jgi:heat shock protein 1/8
MVHDAEIFRKDDEKVKERIEAKNQLENYCFSMKNTTMDEKIKEKLTDDDKKLI